MPKMLEAILILGFIIGLIGWLIWRELKKTDDPLRTGSRIAFGGVILGIWVFKILPVAAQGGFGAIFAVLATVPFMIILGILLTPKLGRWIASPLANLYDDGNKEYIPHANYTIAEARIMQNDFHGAAAEIRSQLRQFPNDQRGWFMLAELQAARFNDMDGAMSSLSTILSQPDAPAHLFAGAANFAADLHIKHSRDPEAARASLQEIIDRFPGSTQAHQAAERIGHLPTKQQLEQKTAPQSLTLQPGHRDLGIKSAVILPDEQSLDDRLDALLAQLDSHPGDSEAREKLILLYVDELRDVDAARTQVNHAIAVPNIAVKQQTRWLHLLASIEIRHGRNLAGARAALERIMTMWPGSGYAEVAMQRIERLAMELRGVENAPEAITLGTYERDLGLKKPGGVPDADDEAEAKAPKLPELAKPVLRTGELLAPKPEVEAKPAPKPLKRPAIKI